jgi:hypothetical protein
MKDRDLSDREDLRREAADTLAIINQAWRSGRVMEMAPYLHEKMVITLPAFTRRVSGRENVIEGFREFSANARVLRPWSATDSKCAMSAPDIEHTPKAETSGSSNAVRIDGLRCGER